MPVKKKIPFDSGHFFITFTCYNWLPLIEITNSYDLQSAEDGSYATNHGKAEVKGAVESTLAKSKDKM